MFENENFPLVSLWKIQITKIALCINWLWSKMLSIWNFSLNILQCLSYFWWYSSRIEILGGCKKWKTNFRHLPLFGGGDMRDMRKIFPRYAKDITKISGKGWPNFKSIAHSLTHSPTWIQEMLVHLKKIWIIPWLPKPVLHFALWLYI